MINLGGGGGIPRGATMVGTERGKIECQDRRKWRSQPWIDYFIMICECKLFVGGLMDCCYQLADQRNSFGRSEAIPAPFIEYLAAATLLPTP